MKVLWLCNIVLPDYADEFEISKKYFAGWISGLLSVLQNEEYEIALCFPIIDKKRLRDGMKNHHQYFTFLCDFSVDDYRSKNGIEMTMRFEQILLQFKPDVVHIWGTEFIHSYAMAIAAENVGILTKVVVHIQGLVSACSNSYLQDLPHDVISSRDNGFPSIQDQCDNFKRRGYWEKELIKKVKYVLGRTEWDYSHVKCINPGIKYYHCGEVLRDEFYEAGKWEYEKTSFPFSIFMSQGAYPIKGTHHAIKAVAILKRLYPDVILEIAGENILNKSPMEPYAKYLYELINMLGVEKNVVFLGWLEPKEIIEKYRKCQLYLLPSALENSPNSLCEAMMIGIPVVASYVGGVPSIIRNNQEGLLYQYNDSEMLACQIEKVFSSCGKNGVFSKERKRVMEYNDRDMCRREIEKIYKEVNDS